MQARTGIRSFVVLAVVLLIAAATLLHVGRMLVQRYPELAMVELIFKAPRTPGNQ